MDVHWWHSEAIKMHVCKLSMDLEKLNFDEKMSMLQRSWFMVSVRPSSNERTWEVAKHSKSYISLVLSNLPRAP